MSQQPITLPFNFDKVNRENFICWWEKHKDNMDVLWYDFLCQYYSEYFEIWYNSDKFDWKNDVYLLEIYCQNYKDIWEKIFYIIN